MALEKHPIREDATVIFEWFLGQYLHPSEGDIGWEVHSPQTEATG